MILFLIFLSELLFLYFLSDRISRNCYALFFRIFGNQEVATGLLTLMFLPGTAVHEFAHLIVAEILRVPTGELSFTPEIVKNENGSQEIKSGYLKIGHTDPIRRYLVGFAPLIFGLMGLVLLVSLFQYFWPQTTILWQQIGLIGLIGYFMFAISNNMFSSKQDLEGFWIIAIVFVLICMAAYFSGLRFNLTGQIAYLINQLANGLIKVLGVVLVINIIVLALNRLFLKTIGR